MKLGHLLAIDLGHIWSQQGSAEGRLRDGEVVARHVIDGRKVESA